MLVYNQDVMELLKKSGYNTTRILKENLLSQSAMQDIRTGKMIGIRSLEKVCGLTGCQPGEIIRYEKEG